MSDFLRKREAFNKAYTKSLDDTSDDYVLMHLPTIFLTMRAKFFDEDDLEYNRAIFVQLKLEDKLEHEFDKSTAYDYMNRALDALDQCNCDLRLDQLGVIVGERCDEELAATIKAELAVCKEQLKAKDNKLKSEEQFNKKIWDQVKVHDEQIKVNAVLIKTKDDQLKLKDELLASKDTELAASNEQLKKKEELMAAMEREVEQIVGEDQLKQLKFKIRFEHLKKTKTVDEVWAELPEENKNVLLDMMIAKQAPKGKPLACVTNA